MGTPAPPCKGRNARNAPTQSLFFAGQRAARAPQCVRQRGRGQNSKETMFQHGMSPGLSGAGRASSRGTRRVATQEQAQSANDVHLYLIGPAKGWELGPVSPCLSRLFSGLGGAPLAHENGDRGQSGHRLGPWKSSRPLGLRVGPIIRLLDYTGEDSKPNSNSECKNYDSLRSTVVIKSGKGPSEPSVKPRRQQTWSVVWRGLGARLLSGP